MENFETKLSYHEIERFKRQLVLNEIGPEGQLKLKNTKILIIGMGGLGSPVSLYLTSAGIGNIGIVDYDEVEISNLHRQIIHNEESIGIKKIKSGSKFLKKLNSSTIIDEYEFINENVISKYDIIMDCTDNIDARYLISDLSKVNGKLYICASVLKWEGQIFVFLPDGPCYRCLFPKKKENIQTCNSAGVIGSMCGIIGSLQALETIKVILEMTKKSKLVIYDGIKNSMKEFQLDFKNQKCLVCLKINPKENYLQNHINNEIKSKCDTEIINLECENLKAIEWNEYIKNKPKYTLIDIRPRNSYKIIHFKNSINIPYSELENNIEFLKTIKNEIVLVCLKGITVKKAYLKLMKYDIYCKFINGGYSDYKKYFDLDFPLL